MKVEELVPGMKVDLAGNQATFVARATHPLWPSLQLVVWRMRDGDWFHDALDLWQDVGTTAPSTASERETNLREALLGERS
jgi:hypothetical protein